MTEERLNPAEEQDEEQRIERNMTVREIFEAGLRHGWATAGLTASVDREYQTWLLVRVEART